ncbi:hypothetical protein K2173_021420 [Erythroxylum novogranatense]|uniref:EF-hand domain-containing protein n=1 Tax=Erythroxylum novogranatense TaxID=1862640 RepID=A0AAV8TVA9_9ROSI|nr:hypothetical protein K2173_021420 [Erythroxylum novogranatense]
MATDLSVCRPYKWFSNKGLGLSVHGRQKSKSSSTQSSPTSPISPSTPSSSSSKQENELKQVFRYFDGDGDGKISALELRAYFGSIGEYMSHEEAQDVISDFDSDGDKLLDFQDFTRLMKREGQDQEEEEDLKKAFEIFEMERGSGRITPKSLQRALHRLGDPKSYDECVTMIEFFDIDGNGVLDFHEFHRMMVA